MKVKEIIEKLSKMEQDREVIIRFGLDKNDDIGYILVPFAIEQIFEDEVAIYAEYTATKEDCDFIGQVDLKEAYLKQAYKQNENIIDRMIDYIMIHQQVKTMKKIFCKYCKIKNGCTYSGIHRNCVKRYFEYISKQRNINEMHDELEKLLKGDK